MSKQKKQAKVFGTLVISLIGWFAVTLTIAHWWAMATATESAMGPTEFLLHEIVRNAPHYVYFLVVGSIYAIILDKRASVQWALLTAALVMCIYALMSRWTFYDRITYLEVGELLVLYALPIAFAGGGALVAHAIAARKGLYDNAET